MFVRKKKNKSDGKYKVIQSVGTSSDLNIEPFEMTPISEDREAQY